MQLPEHYQPIIYIVVPPSMWIGLHHTAQLCSCYVSYMFSHYTVDPWSFQTTVKIRAKIVKFTLKTVGSLDG